VMIRDYLRHSDLHVTNKYLQATTKSKRLAQGKLKVAPGVRLPDDADCSIALAHASVRSLLEWLDANGSFERRQGSQDL
jgi:hypothetical protein